MKKSLFAIAAVTAFAGAAQAQSSVTVYGILDIGYIGGNERLSGPAVNGNTSTQRTFNQIGASAQSTSRLGFRGTEDLGGGLSAFFNFETALSPNNGTFTNLQTRAANIGLAKKGMGRATVGTQNTVVTDAMSPTITGQFNNIVGSMLFPSFSGPASIGGTSSLNQANVNGNSDAFTFRMGNTIKLQTERFYGFTGAVQYTTNSSSSTQGTTGNTAAPVGYRGGQDQQSGWGLGANYQWKKLIVTAAYQSFTATDPYATTNIPGRGANPVAVTGASEAFTVSGLGTTAPTRVNGFSGGTNVKDNQAYVGVTYDFGILKAYGGWVDRKVTSQINPNAYASRSAQEIGVRGNWTPKIESWASVGNGSVKTFGQGEPSANLFGWQLGSNYILSKRTNLYAIYGQNNTSSVSQPAGNIGSRSFSSNNYAVGMRHTF